MYRTQLIMQARMNSQRCPGKAMLNLAGYPVVILAALRAMNSGYPLVIATSTHNQDDPIADAAMRFGIPCHRGSLDNVYDRFIEATQSFNDDTEIVRLTADNVFPDGEFIKDVLTKRQTTGSHHVKTCGGENANVPYGVSAEAFTLGDLRRSSIFINDDADREHVTLALRRHFQSATLAFDWADRNHSLPTTKVPYKLLRATLDIPSDHERLIKVFHGIKDPVGVSLKALVAKLETITEEQSSTNHHLSH